MHGEVQVVMTGQHSSVRMQGLSGGNTTNALVNRPTTRVIHHRINPATINHRGISANTTLCNRVNSNSLSNLHNRNTFCHSFPDGENLEGAAVGVEGGLGEGEGIGGMVGFPMAHSFNFDDSGAVNGSVSINESGMNSGCGGSGDDLTSLSWLHSLDMGGMVPHLATPPTPPASPQPHLPSHQTYASSPPEKKKKVEIQEKVENIDYSVDGSVKPPYSYAALIGMAMKENQNKMTLSAIYKWIKENFAYYKTADPSWQNSIRHNLSLNKCFLKVPRNKDEPGKGGFWKLDPEYADSLVDGVFKKRRPSRPTPPPPTKSKRSKRAGVPPPQQQPPPPPPPPPPSLPPRQHHQHQGVMGNQHQQLGVKVVVQPAQAAFMPPPSNKPPPRSAIFLQHGGIGTEGVINDNRAQFKDELVWSTLLEEEVHDDPWPCRSQELVTDLAQTGDPSTYPTTITNAPTHILQQHQTHHPLHHHNLHISNHSSQQHQQIVTITSSNITSPSLPSLELSPASLGVEEELFTSPEYSEASNDDADSLTSSLDITNGGNWSKGSYTELPSMSTFCNGLTQLTPLEPATAPVLVQDAHACWGPDTNWDEAKTFSLLEANLDLENLIDLDVL